MSIVAENNAYAHRNEGMPPVRLSREENLRIEQADSLWIVFSFVISVIIFAGFNKEVTLGSNIIINIVIAFGFGFEEVLEVAQDFRELI